MAPRQDHDDELTWDGVENMIRAYDERVILPRQTEQHRQNLAVQTEHSEKLNQIVGASSAIKWLLGFILVLIGTILAIIGWATSNHKAILQSDAPSSVVASEYNPWR